MAKSKATTASVGRPRLLADPKLCKLVYETLEMGGSRADASARSGVSMDAINAESKRNPDFADGLRKAEADGKWHLIQKLRTGADADPKWAAWMLERKWPDDWAKRKPDEVTPERLARMIVRLVTGLQAAIPAKYHAGMQAAIESLITDLSDGSVK